MSKSEFNISKFQNSKFWKVNLNGAFFNKCNVFNVIMNQIFLESTLFLDTILKEIHIIDLVIDQERPIKYSVNENIVEIKNIDELVNILM